MPPRKNSAPDQKRQDLEDEISKLFKEWEDACKSEDKKKSTLDRFLRSSSKEIEASKQNALSNIQWRLNNHFKPLDILVNPSPGEEDKKQIYVIARLDREQKYKLEPFTPHSEDTDVDKRQFNAHAFLNILEEGLNPFLDLPFIMVEPASRRNTADTIEKKEEDPKKLRVPKETSPSKRLKRSGSIESLASVAPPPVESSSVSARPRSNTAPDSKLRDAFQKQFSEKMKSHHQSKV